MKCIAPLICTRCSSTNSKRIVLDKNQTERVANINHFNKIHPMTSFNYKLINTDLKYGLIGKP